MKTNKGFWWGIAVLLLIYTVIIGVHDEWAKAENQTSSQGAKSAISTILNSNGVIIGYPTTNSITLKAMAAASQSMYIKYGLLPDKLTNSTPAKSWPQGSAMEITLKSLLPNKQYTYQMLVKPVGASAYTVASSGTFHTARPAGTSFAFTIQADSHRDEKSDLNLYQTALQNIKADRSDFHIDLGDTFMGEKLSRDKTALQARYVEDRGYFAIIGASIPLFLVNGNHEGENGWERTKSADNVAFWASAARQLYFPNRQIDTFYTGSAKGSGSYYAFTWGDALFVMLDPFWNTTQKARSDNEGWSYTLGKTQYDWMKNTLSNSKAKYKFIFIHNLVGGYGKDARGGAEASQYFEWGGNNSDGTYGFDTMRPGWSKPIHQILAENGVTAVFHGHDHFYAKQERDRIVYQLVPQPSHPGSSINQAAEYSYTKGTFLPPAGHLRVSVSSSGAKIQYVSASLDINKNKTICDSYTINPQ